MSWGPLGELAAALSPGMRHELEERRVRELLREDDGNDDKDREHPNKIDLDSGKVTIKLAPAGESGDDPVSNDAPAT